MQRRRLAIVLVAMLQLSAKARRTRADICDGVPQVAGTSIKANLVASGFDSALYVTAPPGDTDRIFVVQQSGVIRVIKSGMLLPTPFLDLSAKVTFSGEQGLLSMAFHPNYATNGQFFVDYIDTTGIGNTVVSRFHVSADPDVADDTSEEIILQQVQPFTNHNGGLLVFGPEAQHYLYVGLGDGGSGGDPDGNGQNTNTWLGKILRIDVDGGTPYAVPPSNPFVGQMNHLPEIWAYGLRNPWRFSFDRQTGDLYIADVGQDKYEEVDFQSATSTGGENYGWNTMEGKHCFNPSSGCNTTGLTPPILEYSHGTNDSNGCAVIGGYVYRGCAMPNLHGRYFYGDLCKAFVRSFSVVGGVAAAMQDDTSQLAMGAISMTSFGEDARGELYVVSSDSVFKIVPGPAPPPGPIPTMPRWTVALLGVLFVAAFGWLVSHRLLAA
ncbi:MAG TPA: PQQ-dependent sugar dehydrogenase [Candidatus Binatia bacterium]|nr:PQQ-dependent sugar dehydrogenase [Candidatus Binatia bacterium]